MMQRMSAAVGVSVFKVPIFTSRCGVAGLPCMQADWRGRNIELGGETARR